MKNWYSATSLVLLALLFLALVMLSSALLKGARLDLTENRLYTLSEGTINLLESIEEPITLEFYFSEDASADMPMVRNFARRVQELLDEMADRAGDRLEVRRIDPRPFSEAEDEAELLGLEAVPVGRGEDSLYLGIAGTNRVDGLEVLPFLSPSREAFLEYELARMVHVLSQPEPPRVGLLSGLPLAGGMDRQTGQRQEPWAIHDELHDSFEIESIEAADEALPDDIDALVLIHPKGLNEALLRAIDRFVVEGGNLAVFVDPLSESDPGSDPTNPMADDRGSTLEPLFEAWGLSFDTERFVADQGQALQVAMQQGQAPARHPGIIGVTRDFMSDTDVITAELDAVNLASPGALSLSEESPMSLEPLLSSSPRSAELDIQRLMLLTDPTELSGEIGTTDSGFTLAARLSGPAISAYPDQNSVGEGVEANMVVVGDTDLLADRFWVQRQRFFGTTLAEPFANNGDFVVNLVDNLLGNADLISVRSRATSNRPFTLVEDLRREAEESLRATEQRLEAELAEAERRLGELQQARGDTDLSVLSPEQEAEIDRFMEQRMEVRQQLRQVRRDLDRDIEALGARVKFVNIALMPILVTLIVLAVVGYRRRRPRRWPVTGEGSS